MNADQTNVLQSVPVEQIFLKWNLNQTRSLLWKTPWSEFDSYSSVWRFIALTPPSVIVPTGSAERRRGLHRVYSSSEQSPEPGPSHSRSHRQRLHEEEGESECGGGPHQTWNQTERSERTRPLSVGAVVTWFLWSRPPGCSQVKETLIVLSFMSLCSGERSSHLLQWNNNTSHFWGGQDATQTHQQDFEHDHQPRGETKNHRRHLCQSQYRFLSFLICILYFYFGSCRVSTSPSSGRCWTAVNVERRCFSGGQRSDRRDEPESRRGLSGPGNLEAWPHRERLSSGQWQSRGHQNTPQWHRADPQTSRWGTDQPTFYNSINFFI